MPQPRAWLKASLFALALLSGCGGGDDNGGDAAESNGSEQASASASGGVIGSARCIAAAQAMGQAAAAMPQAMTGQAGDLKASVEQLKAFAAAAPSEIRAEMKTVAEGYGLWIEAYASSGFDPSKGVAPTQEQIEKLEAASKKLDNTEFQEASERVDAWFKTECRG